MMRTIIITLLVAVSVCGCSGDSSVDRPPVHGPDVLLSDDFAGPPDPEVWQLTDCGGLSKPDGEGNFALVTCKVPAWVTTSLVSTHSWSIEPGETYTATFRIGTPDCLSWGATLRWGLQCYSGDTALGSADFSAGLSDVLAVLIEYRKMFDPCRGYSETGLNVCGEFHDYTLVISDDRIEALIDGELQNHIDLSGDCEGQVESFELGVSITAQDDENKLLIDKITLSRSRE